MAKSSHQGSAFVLLIILLAVFAGLGSLGLYLTTSPTVAGSLTKPSQNISEGYSR